MEAGVRPTAPESRRAFFKAALSSESAAFAASIISHGIRRSKNALEQHIPTVLRADLDGI